MPRLLSTIEQQAPQEALRPFIKGYVFRNAVTGTGAAPVCKAMPLRCVSSIDFFMGDAFETTDCVTAQTVPFASCTIRGPRTYKKYSIRLSGQLLSFSIRFAPAGLYALLGIPAELFRDEAVEGALVLPAVVPEITARLTDCRSMERCVAVVEPYLLKMLHNAASRVSPAVAHMAELIATGHGTRSVTGLQQQVCLGKRQLERNFVKEVGVTPKMYSRMFRFTSALQHKMAHGHTAWANLAYEFGYADQMHLIKDFRQFLDLRPSAFSPEDFAF